MTNPFRLKVIHNDYKEAVQLLFGKLKFESITLRVSYIYDPPHWALPHVKHKYMNKDVSQQHLFHLMAKRHDVDWSLMELEAIFTRLLFTGRIIPWKMNRTVDDEYYERFDLTFSAKKLVVTEYTVLDRKDPLYQVFLNELVIPHDFFVKPHVTGRTRKWI